VLSLPDLVVDFQQLVTLHQKHMGGLERLASLDSPFAEALLARLSQYFGRLGRPGLGEGWLMAQMQANTGVQTCRASHLQAS
jgi:hypothetical protein